ncbi:MAG: N-acyl-D-glucosamine 2-epimerase [Bacteroidales bacterium]|nr:N-acyl-D-glucosamine 2-epimerase [Bacteroidales bacterium]
MLLERMKESAGKELTGNILPWWIKNMPDPERGGFYGRIDGREKTITDAPRGGILNARILWSFSAAYVKLADQKYLEMATRARDYILRHFFDNEYGGTYWSLSGHGKPLETKKQIYSQAFFIYALTWFHKATGDRESLYRAIELYRLIEKHSYDARYEGYFEAFTREWGEMADLRLSEKDANEKKTMNTHLHILEAYTSLYSVWPDPQLRKQLAGLVSTFTERIVDPVTSHLNLFFDEEWNQRSAIVSYGHDIEASWLLCEAADALGAADTIKGVALKIASAAHEGLADDGSLFYEKDDEAGHFDRDRHWWVQSEATVGFLNAWQLSGDNSWLELAANVLDYINTHLTDRENGEWFWSIRADGTVNRDDDKAGFWKCPYHNTRMCLEIMERSGDQH